jgi:hypothetical protein
MQVTVIGLDIAKHVFQVHGIDDAGQVLIRRQLAVSMLLSWYVSNFGSYNATYGSLGAVTGFMTWI